MDMTFSQGFVEKIVLMFVWKRPKVNKKEAGLAHLKNSFDKMYAQHQVYQSKTNE